VIKELNFDTSQELAVQLKPVQQVSLAELALKEQLFRLMHERDELLIRIADREIELRAVIETFKHLEV